MVSWCLNTLVYIRCFVCIAVSKAADFFSVEGKIAIWNLSSLHLRGWETNFRGICSLASQSVLCVFCTRGINERCSSGCGGCIAEYKNMIIHSSSECSRKKLERICSSLGECWNFSSGRFSIFSIHIECFTNLGEGSVSSGFYTSFLFQKYAKPITTGTNQVLFCPGGADW